MWPKFSKIAQPDELQLTYEQINNTIYQLNQLDETNIQQALDSSDQDTKMHILNEIHSINLNQLREYIKEYQSQTKMVTKVEQISPIPSKFIIKKS